MFAYTFRQRLALDDFAVVERPTPEPGPRDLVLAMRAASLNYRDLAIARDGYGAFRAPLVPLSDGAGVVVARGPEVTRFALGDLVCPVYVPDWRAGPPAPEVVRRRLGGPDDGVLAERVRVHEDDAVRAPRHLDAIHAATLPIAAVTAWEVLFGAGATPIRPGDVVAVQGTGGVSLFVLQLAHAAGARVLVGTRDAARLSRLAALGAEAFVAADAAAFAAALLERTGRRGVDLLVDVVGGPSLGEAIAATRVGGSIALVGFVGGAEATLDRLALIRRALTLRAVSVGSRASFEALVRALEAGGIVPVVDAVVPFADALDAYRRLEHGRPFGKVVIAFDAVTP